MVNLIRTSKNAFMLFSGTATRMVATFLFIIFSANHLGVEGFGKYSLIIHYFELFVSLTATASGILLIREVSSRPQDRNKLVSAACGMTVLLALVTPFLLIPLSLTFQYSSDTIWGIGIACLGLFPAGVAVVYEAVFVAEERAEFVTVGVAIECLFRIGVSIAILMLGYGIIELSIVLVFSRVILAIVYYFLLRRICDHRFSFCGATTIQFAKKWRVFAAENWMATIYTNLDVIVISYFAGEKAVGLYSAAWRYVRLGTVAAKSFTTAIFPTMTRLYAETNPAFGKIVIHTFRVMCLIALPVIALVSVIPERVIDVLFNEEYANSAAILRILIWVLLLEFINPFLSHVLFSQQRQRYSMIVAAIGLVSNLILMFFLVPKFGPEGAAMACVMTASLATFVYLYFLANISAVIGMLVEFVRLTIAASTMGLAVFYVQQQSWLVVMTVSILVYGSMLFVVQAIRTNDLNFIKRNISPRATAS